MNSRLPLRLDDLLRQRTVEGERIEYKAGWNPDAVIRTLCAFANDFENLGGGYVVLGQDCDAAGQPIFPPAGLQANQLDKIQRELLAYCNLIQPPYFPILATEHVEGRNLIVLWVAGGAEPTVQSAAFGGFQDQGVPLLHPPLLQHSGTQVEQRGRARTAAIDGDCPFRRPPMSPGGLG